MRRGNQKKDFFTVPEYLQWNEQYNKDRKWVAKYYKVCMLPSKWNVFCLNVVAQGLGTSTNDDAKEYFSHMGAHMIPFAKLRDEERPLIDLAFSKKKADDRKDWLRKFKVNSLLGVSHLLHIKVNVPTARHVHRP